MSSTCYERSTNDRIQSTNLKHQIVKIEITGLTDARKPSLKGVGGVRDYCHFSRGGNEEDPEVSKDTVPRHTTSNFRKSKNLLMGQLFFPPALPDLMNAFRGMYLYFQASSVSHSLNLGCAISIKERALSLRVFP